MPKKTQKNSPSNEEVKVTKIPTIRVIGKLSNISPDLRQYKPSTPQIFFDPMLQVVVNVPATTDLVINGDKIMSAQLTNQAEPEPIFTPLGMRYIIDQFEAVMSNPQTEEPEEKPTDSDNDWGDEIEPEKETAKKSEDDEWDDEITESDEKADFDDDKEWED